MSNEIVTKSSRFYCVSLTPDICKTPVGSSTPPLPYNIVGEFAEAENVSPNVKSHSEPVILHGRSIIPTVKGDAAGRAGGIKSGTTGKQVETKTASSAHRANGAELVQVGREVWMNARNTIGKIYEHGGEAARPTLTAWGGQISEARLNAAAQAYKDKYSEELHGAGAGLADTGATVMTASAAVGAAGVAVAATGVGAPVAAVMEAGAMAGGIAGGAAVAGGTAVDAAATVLDRTADFILTGDTPDWAGTAMQVGANAAESVARAALTSKVPGGKWLGKWLASKLSPHTDKLKKKILGEKPTKKLAKEPPKPPSKGSDDDGKSSGKKREPKSDAPSDCCPHDRAPANKPVKGRKPVHFGTGQEVLYETDFALDGAVPIVWTRCYRSGNECGDWGLLGARWASEYTTSLSVLDAGIVYHDDSGRALRLPHLAPGQAHDSRKEGFVLARDGAGAFTLTWRDGGVDRFARAGAAWLPHGHDGVNPMLVPAAPVLAERHMLVRSAGRDGRGFSVELHLDAAPGGMLLRIRGDDGAVVEAMREALRETERDASAKATAPRIARVEQVLDDGTRICHAAYRYEAEPPQRGADGKEVAAPRGQPGRRYNLVRQANLLGDARGYAYRHHLLVGCTSYTGFVQSIEWISLELLRARWAGSALDEAQLAARHPITPDNSYRARAVATGAADGGEAVAIDYIDGDTTRVTDNGGVLEYVFNANWLATDVRRVVGGVATSLGRREWDRDGMLLAEIDASGRTGYGYDAAGNLTEITDPAGRRSDIAYDAHNQPVAVTDALGNVTRRSYDEVGRPATVTDALGHTTAYRYDGKGRLGELIDAKGGSKKFLYDAAGRVFLYTDCSGHSTRYGYDPAGRLISIRSAEGEETRYAYDAVGRLVQLSHPDGAQERFDFDADGNLQAHTDANGHRTRYRYNGHGLPVERIDANGHALGYRYDAGLQLVELVNGNGESYRFTYHVEGWLASETGFDGKVTRYGYDKAGQLTSSECAGLRTDYVRDRRGLLCLKTTADGMVRYAYDALGRMTAVSSIQSELRFRYDALGQLTEERSACFLTAPPAPAVAPNSVRVADASFVTTHAYDELGNRIQRVLPNGRRVDTLRYGSGHWHGTLWQGTPLADIERDRLHRERQRRLGGGAQLQATRAYDPRSRVAAMTLGRAGGKQDGPKLRERRFSYDPVGNLINIEHGWHTPNDTLGKFSYTYDPLGQLLTAVQPGLAETFAFDPAGNLLDAAPEGDASDAARPAAVAHNLLASYRDAYYEYDGRGNAVSKCIERSDGGYELDLAYDAENRLIRAVRTNGWRRDSARYFYDPFGRRIGKQVTEERWRDGQRKDAVAPEHTARHTTLFAWDGDALAQEVQQDKTVTYLYEPDSFVPLARIESAGGYGGAAGTQESSCGGLKTGPSRAVYMWHVDEWDLPSARQGEIRRVAVEADANGEEVFQTAWRRLLDSTDSAAPQDCVVFYNCDHLGTPRELVDGQGRVVWSARYKAWGRVILHAAWSGREASAQEFVQPLRFQGQYEDSETGLHYNRSRYYDPDAARYITQDPIGTAGGLNSYTYAPNSTAWIDPLGLSRCMQIFYRGDRDLTFMKSHAAHIVGYAEANKKMNGKNQAKLMKDHAEHSLDNVSPFVSVTTNTKVAEYFATNGGERSGYVYTLKIPCDRVIKNSYNSKAVYVNGKYIDEDEWLVKNYIKPSEIVSRRKVL